MTERIPLDSQLNNELMEIDPCIQSIHGAIILGIEYISNNFHQSSLPIDQASPAFYNQYFLFALHVVTLLEKCIIILVEKFNFWVV